MFTTSSISRIKEHFNNDVINLLIINFLKGNTTCIDIFYLVVDLDTLDDSLEINAANMIVESIKKDKMH